MKHIRKCLPDLKVRVNKLITDNQSVLVSCGEPVIDKQKTLLDVISKFANAYTAAIDGNSKKLEAKELLGGARISNIFHVTFYDLLEEIVPTGGLTPREILTVIQNASGPRPPLFVPQISFELLVKDRMSTMKEPSLKCVDLVHAELKRIFTHCGVETFLEKQRFPRVYERINDIVINLLNSRIVPAKEYVEHLVGMQLDYINTKHPEFDEKIFDDLVNDLSSLPNIPDGNMALAAGDARPRLRAIKNDPKWIGLSEREERDADLVEQMVNRYFDITRKSIQDMVPKTVMRFLVNHIRENVQNHLVRALYTTKEEEINDLSENKLMAHRRKDATEMLEALNKANDLISEVRENSLF